jgi:hypothetical protein
MWIRPFGRRVDGKNLVVQDSRKTLLLLLLLLLLLKITTDWKKPHDQEFHKVLDCIRNSSNNTMGKSFLENLLLSQLVKKFPAFMEPKDSQQTVIDPYPMPDAPSPHSHTLLP